MPNTKCRVVIRISPKKTIMATAIICRNSFLYGFNTNMSSFNPAKNRTIIAPSIYFTRVESEGNEKIILVSEKATKIASPPNTGVVLL